MKIRIALFVSLAASLLMMSCGNAAEEAAKKALDSLNAAVKADSIHDADSAAQAVAAESMRKAQMDSTRQSLAGKWWHNRADDANGNVGYRKDGFKLPPARGREFFEFSVDGAWSWHPIAPADGNSDFKGSWTSSEKGKYAFTYEKTCKGCPTGMTVVSLTGDLLICTFDMPQ